MDFTGRHDALRGSANVIDDGKLGSGNEGKIMTSEAIRPAPAAVAIAAIAVAAILGAYFFQYVMKLPPCPLCLEQRIPYYVAIPLALLVALAAVRGAPASLVRLGFAALALVMIVSALLGVYHAGIEWKLWPGPSECTGALPALTGGDLLRQIESTSVVRCDEAAWRLLGLSLAGYNALISLALAAVAGLAAARAARA